MVAVTLRCVPSFKLRGVDGPEPLDDVLDSLDERARADHFEFWTFPHSPLALTRTNSRTDDERKVPWRAQEWLEDILMDNYAFELLNRVGRRFPQAIPTINRSAARAASKRERVDWSFRIFASPRLVRFTEMEYSVPREHGVEALRGAREILERHPVSFPSSSGSWPATTRCSHPRTAATARTSPSTCSRACPGRRRSARSRR